MPFSEEKQKHRLFYIPYTVYLFHKIYFFTNQSYNEYVDHVLKQILFFWQTKCLNRIPPLNTLIFLSHILTKCNTWQCKKLFTIIFSFLLILHAIHVVSVQEDDCFLNCAIKKQIPDKSTFSSCMHLSWNKLESFYDLNQVIVP